ncbi:cytochrome P450 [Coprinopsis marcescibilis]|uniref:Cytochrome P450 n=1 Tax=Coprinopsis marcescibilis TaxID=230819 RepID=A0A5C3KU68_COPMA|nr:cytochrome P450 [Coprinopsis marcescibilis]
MNLSITASAGILGLTSHLIFKRYEPSFITYVLVNGLVSVGSVFVAYASSVSRLSLLPTVLFVAKAVATFNASLATSIALYRLSPWHPLAGYPGPVLARLSKWLHEQYGAWVRVGPNELSVNSSGAIRPIYSKLFRGPSYQAAPQDADALITAISREEHDRRLVARYFPLFSEIISSEQCGTRTDQFVEILRGISAEGSIDMAKWINLWSLDITGDMAFSGGFETLKSGGDTEGWIEVLHIGLLFVALLGNVPWMRDIIAAAPQPGPIREFHKFTSRKVGETKLNGAVVNKDIIGIIQNETVLTKEEAISDSSFIIIAGSDTIAQGLAAFFRYIAGDEKIQERLRAEIITASTGQDEVDDATLSRLPYLDACVQESLRLKPPVAAGPPRWSGGKTYVVENHVIPPETTVSCPNYALHHDHADPVQAKYFVDPEEFLPERWLSSFSKGVHNTEAYVPFCYGPGNCIGKPVALFNMKLMVAKVLTNFRISFSKSVDVAKFDESWKEYGIWKHDPLLIDFVSIQQSISFLGLPVKTVVDAFEGSLPSHNNDNDSAPPATRLNLLPPSSPLFHSPGSFSLVLQSWLVLLCITRDFLAQDLQAQSMVATLKQG